MNLERKKRLTVQNIDMLLEDATYLALDEHIQIEGLLQKYYFCKSALKRVKPYVEMYLDQIGLTKDKEEGISIQQMGLIEKEPWTWYFDPVDKLIALGLATDTITLEENKEQEKENPMKLLVYRKK